MTRPSKLSEEEVFNGKEAVRYERMRTDFCTRCSAPKMGYWYDSDSAQENISRMGRELKQEGEKNED